MLQYGFAQICSASVSPGRNGFSGHTGEAKFQTLQLISVLIPAVYSNAASFTKATAGSQDNTCHNTGKQAGNNTL